MRKFLWTTLLALVLPLALAGCGGGSGGSDDNGDDNATGDNDFVGSWALAQAIDGSAMFIDFNEDGSFVMKDCAECDAHMTGTYTVDGDTATGPLENPGVGTGEIVAELDGDDLILDFVEFWHSPPKHNPYTGSKI